MNKKTLKSLKKLNNFLDDDYQKLCDRYHDLELSHNRKQQLLLRTEDVLKTFFSFCESSHKYVVFSDEPAVHSLLTTMDHLLFMVRSEAHWNGRAYTKRIK